MKPSTEVVVLITVAGFLFRLVCVGILAFISYRICEREDTSGVFGTAWRKIRHIFLLIPFVEGAERFIGLDMMLRVLAQFGPSYKEALLTSYWHNNLSFWVRFSLVFLLAVLALCMQHKHPLDFLGLRGRAAHRGFVWGLGFLILVGAWLCILRFSRNAPAMYDAGGGIPVWQELVVGVLLAPLCLEILFTGHVYVRFREIMGPGRATVFCALLSMLFHPIIFGLLWLYPLAVGLAACLAYEKSNSLIGPVCGLMAVHGVAMMREYGKVQAVSWWMLGGIMLATVIAFLEALRRCGIADVKPEDAYEK